MRLVVQIPCLNEAMTLPGVIADIPRAIPGIDDVRIVVIDDGSADDTSGVARQAGADRVVRFPARRGLAAAFAQGLAASLELGADIVVNTDGDHQYPGRHIPALVAPILEGRADIVIGDRQVETLAEFSPLKRRLQALGNRVVRSLTALDVRDATSGFRAYSRRAALRLNVFSTYTYTLETLIQAAHDGMPIVSVPIGVNPKTRESRLMRGMWSYIFRSAVTLLRISMMYAPLRAFTWLAALIAAPGLALGLRFIYHYLTGHGEGKIQSLILAAVLLLMGFGLAALGLLADLVAANRRLAEEALWRVRALGGGPGAPPRKPPL
jgi:glycosyltransferase involved in cell wall biosynthesis